MRDSRFFQRPSDEADIVGSAAAAAGLGHDDGCMIQIIFSGKQGIHHLSNDQKRRVAGIVIYKLESCIDSRSVIILQDDQIQVVITPQGLVTQDLCRMIAKEEMQTAIDSLTTHNTAGDAHSALFASKAPLSHSHSASSITGGTLSGLVMAQNNVSYTTAQLRNITLAAYEPVGGVNGQIWIKYLA